MPPHTSALEFMNIEKLKEAAKAIDVCVGKSLVECSFESYT